VTAVRPPVGAGQTLPPRDFGVVTMTDIVRYQGASGDMNPMHHDDVLAQASGFPAAFGVGMLNAGYLATYCTDLYGTDTVRRFRTRFRNLVWRGDRLTATGRVVRFIDDPSGERRVEVEFEITNQDGVVAVSGGAQFVVS
jgi:acyl dehydratase